MAYQHKPGTFEAAAAGGFIATVICLTGGFGVAIIALISAAVCGSITR